MGLSGALSIAASGLDAIQAQLSVSSQNVANASTPGYAKESVAVSSLSAGGTGSGVVVGLTTRTVDTLLDATLYRQNAVVSSLQTTSDGLSGISALQGSTSAASGASGTLSDDLGNVQSGLLTLDADPTNAAAQQAVVSAASSLATSMNTMSAAYQTGRQAAQEAVGADVQQANAALTQIGKISDQITQLRATGISTADLENQRASVMTTLSNIVSVRFQETASGDMLVSTADGTALPTHQTDGPLATADATLGVASAYPATIPPITLNGKDVTGSLAGGVLGANITLRDRTLPTMQAQLDSVAQSLASRFSAQGLTLFTAADGTVPPAVGNGTSPAGEVGFSGEIQVNPAVTANAALIRDGTNDVTGSPTGASSFTTNTTRGSADTTLINRLLTYALGPDAQAGLTQPAATTSGLGIGGTLNAGFSGSSDIISLTTTVTAAQAATISQAASDLTNETATQSALTNKVAGVSGVSVDDEMASVVTLQNAYQANAKVIAAVQTMFTALLTAID